MHTTGDLEALEAQAYRTTWEDGILDLLLGLGLVMLGILYRTDVAGLAGVFVAVLLLPAWGVAKKFITVPRLGYVEFSDVRKAEERGVSTRLVAVGIGTLVLAVALYSVLASGGGGLRETLTEVRAGYVLFGTLIAFGVGLAGSMIGLSRLRVYAGIILVATGVGYVTGLALEDYLLIAGLVITACAAVILRRFLVRYPLPRGGSPG